ncbi:hypothetical protein [Aliiglaciecola sp. LCG003]|uniref:hypothetical protein n=1 Tax=Aliiglaciecola sp. LCG003 TaxID=3053655 RepID=UPI0025735DA2|nr:hypothetical protein [Aliiglaciecola sp. LCG003]WJG08337.1 hypothetical protein QR722_13430 [Aliiglaciecola sp. LCG003]
MTLVKRNSLSDFQRAILTHIGITPWQLKNLAPEEASSSHSGEQKSSENIKPQPIPVQAISSEQKQAGLARLKQQIAPKAKSAEGKVLLCMDAQSAQYRLVQDVLLSIAPNQHKPFMLSAQSPEAFCDFSIAWKIGTEFSLTQNVIETPPLNLLSKAPNKQKLWKLLQTLPTA